MMVPVKRRSERSLGEMISSVSFYGLGIYAILEAMLLHEEGAPLLCLGDGTHRQRLSTGRPLADTRRLEKDNPVTAPKFQQTFGGRQPRKATANHQPVGADGPLGLGIMWCRSKNGVPAGDPGITRQSRDLSL